MLAFFLEVLLSLTRVLMACAVPAAWVGASITLAPYIAQAPFTTALALAGATAVAFVAEWVVLCIIEETADGIQIHHHDR